MNGTELLHFSWSLCIGAEVAVQTAAGAGPATRGCSQSSRLSLSSGEDWLHVRSGRDGSSREIKLLTRVRVLNKRVATCPIRKVARVK